MPEQQTELFERSTQHPGAKERWQPHRRHSSGEDTRDASYQRLQSQLGRKQKRYLRLMKKAATEGLKTKSGAVIHDLTDKEAAAILGWDRTSVNGRRNELCGGSGSTAAIKKQPLIVKSQERKCHVTGNTVTAWKAVPQLFD